MHFQEEKYMHICKAYKSANFTFPFSPQFRSLFRKILLVTSAKRPVKHTIQGERKRNPHSNKMFCMYPVSSSTKLYKVHICYENLLGSIKSS